MKMKKPESIIVERDAIEKEVCGKLGAAQLAYCVLVTGRDQSGKAVVSDSFKGLAELVSVDEIPLPDQLSEAWLDSVIEAKSEVINADGNLTRNQKVARIGLLKSTARNLRQHVKMVEEFVQSVPAGRYVYDEDVKNFHIDNIENYIDELATREVPPEAEEHWQHISKARAAVDELRAFEKSNMRVKKSLNVILRATAESTAEEWATGSNRRDDRLAPEEYEERTSFYL